MRHIIKILTVFMLAYGAVSIAQAETAQAIAAGANHSCLITSVGGVVCWGNNQQGQLGDNSIVNKLTPVAVSGLSSGVTAIAAGASHTCALTSAGAVKCWGYNISGQLGDNSTVRKLTPVAVVGLSSGVTAIAAGANHTCAITSAGGVVCWGYNSDGQLGVNSTVSKSTPVAVIGLSSGVTAIAAGSSHTCAINYLGGVVCWGDNRYGGLGDQRTVSQPYPVGVHGLSSGVTTITAGAYSSCALTNTGGMQCWGYNYYGQLGDNSTVDKLAPIAVSGLSSGVVAIEEGLYHSCALTSAGSMQCWGYNLYGQLGDNTLVNKLTPVVVSGLSSGITAIAAGSVHSCALTSIGSVKCWGVNSNGQLGDNTTADKLTPVWVVGFDDADSDGVKDDVDAFPTNAAASIDTDHDGMPDSWNVACDSTCQNSSGLVLDNDNDDDGIPNAIDPSLLWAPLTVNGGYKGSTISDTQNRQ